METMEETAANSNMSPDQGDGDRAPNAQSGRVTIRPTTFYRNNPQVWFRQLESQFALATSSQTRFHYVMGALPEDVAVNLPMDVIAYETLKEQIIGIYQKSRQELFKEALESILLHGHKPSVCFMRIKRGLEDCNLTVVDKFTRRRFLQALPPTTRVALSARHNLPLEDFAKLADTIFQYSTTDHQVAAVRNDDNRDKDRAKFSKYQLPQIPPLYHSVTDKSQKFVNSTCSTHNTQNDANHGVSGLIKSLRQSLLLQDHQRQHRKRQTKNQQLGSNVHWG